MGQQETPGETEEAKTATGAVNSQWPERRSPGPPYLHLRRHHGWKIEQLFKDVKEVWGAGQQQVRNVYACLGAFTVNLVWHSLVEAWAWTRPDTDLVRRPVWDQEERRPSHADKRKALQQEILRAEIQTVLGEQAELGEFRRSRGPTARSCGLKPYIFFTESTGNDRGGGNVFVCSYQW